MAQERVNGQVEALNAIGRAFAIVNVNVAGTDTANLEAVVKEIQAQNVSVTAIGDLSGASVNMLIEGHDPAALPTATGYTVTDIGF